MHSKFKATLQQVILATGSLLIFANHAPALTLVTSPTRPTCDSHRPCLVMEKKTKQNFRVTFDFKDNEGNGRSIEKITIENLKTRKKTSFATPEAEAVLPKEFFKFFTDDFNKDGHTDLALYAYSSANEGPMYYRFIYDPETKSYGISGPRPENESKEK